MATLGDIGNALIDNGVTRWAKRAGEKIAGATIPGTSGAVPVPGATIDLSNVSANPRTGGVGAMPVAQAASYTPPVTPTAAVPAKAQSPMQRASAMMSGPATGGDLALGKTAKTVGTGAGNVLARGTELLNNKWVGGAAKLGSIVNAGRDIANDPSLSTFGQVGVDLAGAMSAPVAMADMGARGTTNLMNVTKNGSGMGAFDVAADAFDPNGKIVRAKVARSMDGRNHPFLNMPWQEGGFLNPIQERPVAPVAAVAPKDDPTKGWTQPAPVAAAPDIAQTPLNRGRSKDGQIVISNTLPANFDVGNSASEQIRSAGFEGMERQSKLDRANGVVPNLTGNRPSGADTGVGGGARGGRPARPARVDPYEQEANDNATMARARAAGFDPASTTAPKKPTNYGAIHENPAFSAKQREEDEKYDAQKAGYDLMKSGGAKRPANIVKMEQLRDDIAYEAKYGDIGTFLAAKAAMKNFAHLDTNNASRENTRLREAGDANTKLADAMKGQTEAATKAAEAYIKGTVPKIMVDGKQVDDPNYEPLVRRIISEDGYDPGNLSPQDQADISNAAALSLKAHKQNQKWYDFLPGVTNSSQGPTSNLDDLVPTKTSRRWNGLGSEYDTKAGTLDIRTLTQPEIDLAERFKTNAYKAERNQRRERMAARQAKRKPE